jgi:hypothetical protein
LSKYSKKLINNAIFQENSSENFIDDLFLKEKRNYENKIPQNDRGRQ